MDEGRKRVIGIMAAILASLHMQTADDLFGGPQGSPRTDKLIAASIQWAEKIMGRLTRRLGTLEGGSSRTVATSPKEIKILGRRRHVQRTPATPAWNIVQIEN
jgi:hypothetical protein